MNKLYETNGNALDRDGYASLNGYTMHREQHHKFSSDWVLRNPNGEYVDGGPYRNYVALRNGFEIHDDLAS